MERLRHRGAAAFVLCVLVGLPSSGLLCATLCVAHPGTASVEDPRAAAGPGAMHCHAEADPSRPSTPVHPTHTGMEGTAVPDCNCLTHLGASPQTSETPTTAGLNPTPVKTDVSGNGTWSAVVTFASIAAPASGYLARTDSPPLRLLVLRI